MRALLGERPAAARPPGIEFLHPVQDRYGCLEARHLRALAADMRLPLAEVYEVATFYHHFDVVKEGESKPAPVTVRVCDRSLHDGGRGTPHRGTGGAARPRADAPCARPASVLRRGARRPGRQARGGAGERGRRAGLRRSGDFAAEIPDYVGYDRYAAEGGYRLLAACRAGEMTREAVIEALSASGPGPGGAGLRRAQMADRAPFPGPRLMTVNGDEGEPGTFKDRFISNPTRTG